MGYEPALAELVEQMKQASANIAAGDIAMNQRLDGFEKSLNQLYRQIGRPALSHCGDDDANRQPQRTERCTLTAPALAWRAPGLAALKPRRGRLIPA
jgi:hypothetical protein